MSAQKSKKKTHSAMTRERITTYGLFCLPGFIAYCVFLIFPILMGIYYSFMDWNGISKSYNFIGFANYAKLLTDKKFGEALLFNFRYTIMLIVGVVALVLMLNRVPYINYIVAVFLAIMFLTHIGANLSNLGSQWIYLLEGLLDLGAAAVLVFEKNVRAFFGK